MKIPTKQQIKIMFAISTMLATSIIIYNQKKLTNKVAMVTQDKKSNFTQIKYASGSEILGVSNNDGEESLNKSIIQNEGTSIFNNKLKLKLEDKARPNNIENIDTKVLEDNMIINFEKPQDNGTNYEYIIKNNKKEKKLNFYAKSEVKGYSYLIDSNPKNESSKETNKLDDSPIVIQNLNWNNDYYLHIRSFDESNNYSENKTFKLDLPSEGINIKYIDINSNENIATDENIEGIAKQTYNVADMLKNIEGYKLINIDGETSGTLKKEKINILYEYARNATVKVNYIDKATGKEISSSTYIDGYEGKEVEIKSKEISGYTYDKATTTTTTNMQAGLNNINKYYTEIPKGTINVKYVDKDTKVEIAEREVLNNYVNHNYKTEQKHIEGYELEQVPSNAKGTISTGETEVVYYYKNTITETKEKKKLEPTIVQIKYIDYDTKKILKTEKITADKDNKIKINMKKIEGYKIMSINDFDEEGTIIDELINSLDKDDKFIQKKSNDGKIIIPKKINSSVKSEYEIVMNCDDSDYIIYYKK